MAPPATQECPARGNGSGSDCARARSPPISQRPRMRINRIGRAGALRVEGVLAGDLAAMSRLARSWGGAGTTLGDLAGRWSAHATVQEVDDGWQLGGKLDVPELLLPASKADRSRRRS